ncbi:MAG: T9SS type A sorting domain-containing protein [Saprospiraceae bacterium]
MWHSHDDGQTWNFQNTPGYFKYDGFVKVGNIFYGSGGETSFAKSEDFGATWTSLPTGPLYSGITTLATAGGKPLATTYDRGVFRWEEASQTFQPSNDGLHSAAVSSLANGGGIVWANTGNGVFRFDEQQQDWNQSPFVSETRRDYKTMASNDEGMVCVVHQSQGYFYYSADSGVTWDSIYPPQGPWGETYDISRIKAFGNAIFVRLEFEGWRRTSDFGQSWNELPNFIKEFTEFNGVYVGGNWNGDLYISTDQGVNWSIQPNPWPGNLAGFFVANDLLFASLTFQDGIYWSNRMYASSDGITWKYAHDGLPHLLYGYDPDLGTYADFFGHRGQYFMYHTSLGFFTSLDTAKTWVPVQKGYFGSVVLSDSTFYSGGYGGGVVRAIIPDVYGALAQGTVYKDDNNNGTREPNEGPLPNIRVSLEDPGTWYPFYMTTSQSDGSYALGVTPSADDTLRPLFLPNFNYVESINPPYRIVGNGGTGLDFGIKLTPGINDLAVHGNYFGRPRPGFELGVGISYANAGTTEPDATISVNLDDHLTYLDASPPPTAVFGDSLVWSVAALPLFNGGNIWVRTNVPPNTPLGTAIKSTCHISNALPDLMPADNHRVLCDTAVGAFDPNEKRVEPADGLTVEEIAAGKEILYTVQFQNTGTFQADRVRITDLLDSDLYYPSCRFVAASHPVETFRLSPSGLLEIIFEHIMLPDSNTNEPASHGFVTFAIQRKKAFDPFHTVLNKAAIYFDFNEPILTNMVTSPIKTQSVAVTEPIENTASELLIFPNPAQQTFRISTKNKLAGQGVLIVQNTAGQTLLQQNVEDLSAPMVVPVTKLPAGVYIVRVVGSGKPMSGRVLVHHEK